MKLGKDAVIEKVREMMAAPSCSAEAKAAGQTYLDALGTAEEHQAAKDLVVELEEDVSPIDSTIGFFGSPDAAQIFGAEKAAKMLAHAKEVKENGGIYCDCAACSAGAVILENRDSILS